MGVNKAILVGNLGADPELRYTNNQTAVCTLSIATGERRKDPSGQWVDHTEWHKVVVFGKTAENCTNYLKKGREVFVEGRIQTRKWQDKEGRDRYTTEVVANNVQFLGGKGAGAGAGPSRAVETLKTADAVAAKPSGPPPADEISFDDDDIPF